MKRTVLKLLLLNIILFTVAVGIFAVGYEYDKANRIYPEMYDVSYDTAIMAYGKRWERISKFIISTTVIIDIVAILILYRRNQKEVVVNLIEINK